MADIAAGWRSLRRAPRSTALAVTVLSLTIGPGTVVFTLVDVVLIRPMVPR